MNNRSENPSFTIGEEVEVIDSFGCESARMGDICTIKSIAPNPLRCDEMLLETIRKSDSISINMFNYRFKKIGGEMRMAHITPTPLRPGEIISTHSIGDITFVAGSTFTAGSSATGTTPPSPEKKGKMKATGTDSEGNRVTIGDVVCLYNDSSSTTKLPVGTIKEIRSDGRALVEREDGRTGGGRGGLWIAHPKDIVLKSATPPVSIKIGDTVILTTPRYGDSLSNPVWQGMHGCIIGKVTKAEQGERICVLWNNNNPNSYIESDLTIANKKIQKIGGKYMVKYEEKRKPSKEIKEKLIKVDERIHSALLKGKRTYDKHEYYISGVRFPFSYILGKDKDNIIRGIVKLVPADNPGGCYYMMTISADGMAGATLILAKRGLTICGIARVGRFDPHNTKERGSSLSDMGKEAANSYVISISTAYKGIVVENDTKERTKIRLDYAVAKTKRKEVVIKEFKY